MKNAEIEDLLGRQEGRTLEFKKTLPSNSDIAKTAVAFANDAGGDIVIGVDDRRNIVGLPEEDLPRIEEQISNLIYDRCYPSILPDISFLSTDGRNVVRVRIYRGSTPPYYLKAEGKVKGTYIRVGSNNRLADEEVIMELERRRRNISFDAEIVLEKTVSELDCSDFRKIYAEKTGEELDSGALEKLELVREERGEKYPTNALVLLSNDQLKAKMFPNAKIECALFKGHNPDNFIDRKTIDGSIALQAEEAFSFVKRHINESAEVQGIYTVTHWEYPVKAIREIIRNAVVHRQYSLLGKDIKIAVYDDMVEITSPGLVPPSIDYSAMESRQSDARNKTIAPVFKKLGIIDQWGNGLKMVADELKKYPEIEFRWREVGLSLQVQFVKKTLPKAESEALDESNFGRYAGQYSGVKSRQGSYATDQDEDGGLTIRRCGKGYGISYGGRYYPEPSSGILSEGPQETFLTRKVLQSLLALIAQNPRITIPQLAAEVGLSQRSCERAIATLKSEGSLVRRGTARSGLWEVKNA